MLYDLIGIVLYGMACASFASAVSGLNAFVSAGEARILILHSDDV